MARRPKRRPEDEIDLSQFRLHAKGRWLSGQRQIVEISYRGQSLGSLALGPARWAVLAILIHAAVHAAVPDDAYLNNQEVARMLEALNSPFAFADHIKAYLHALRGDLGRFLRHHLGKPSGSRGWGEILIPTHTLGYHVAVPAENLRITTLDRTGQTRGGQAGPSTNQDMTGQ